jgi:MOB kinase activator 1
MLGGLFSRDKNKTFKPLKPHARGDKQKALHQYAQATLGSGDVRSAVALPPGESEEEWIALHLTDCYNELSLLYGAVSEWCTRDACPVMCVARARAVQ